MALDKTNLLATNHDCAGLKLGYLQYTGKRGILLIGKSRTEVISMTRKTLKLKFLVIAAIAVLPAMGTVSCQRTPDLGNGLFARLDTNRGNIFIRLEFEKTPLTVTNFVALAEGRMDVTEGRPFFNNNAFFAVAEEALIMAGCPDGTGRGDLGYYFPEEFHPLLAHDRPGIVGMGHSAPGMNNSHFFISKNALPWLNDTHTAFGRVVAGQNVVNSIERGDRIRRVTIIRNGPAANAFVADQGTFDALLQKSIVMAEERYQARRDAAIALFTSMFPNAVTSPLGVMYYIQEEGAGDRAVQGQQARLYYTTTIALGEVIRSIQSPVPAALYPVGVGSVIPGFDEMLMSMRVGERRVAIVPPELAYGDRWVGGNLIPPNSFLIYELELVSLEGLVIEDD